MRAIVNERGCTEYETFVEHLAEDPLCPLIVILIRGIDYAGPVEGEADLLELCREFLDISVRQYAGVRIEFDCGVFRGKTESVKADREQNVIALHSLLSGNYFKAGIRLDVTNVHTCTAGIREFNQRVKFGKRIIVFRFKRMVVFPRLLPFFFNGFKIVGHGVYFSLNYIENVFVGKLPKVSTAVQYLPDR